MKSTFTILLLILFCTSLYSQHRVLATKIYFDKNNSDISEYNKNILDSFFDQFSNNKIIKVNLYGNADKDADSAYNIMLSEKRTKEVKDFLLNYDIEPRRIFSNSFGEDRPIELGDDEDSKRLNRRVDIRVIYEINNTDTDSSTYSVVSSGDSCNKDTAIILEDGTQVIFNICEYKKYKDCIVIETANNIKDMLNQGISLRDTSGIPIATCGMIRFTINPECGNLECLKKPLLVRFPVQHVNCNICQRNASEWKVNDNGEWYKNTSGQKIRIVTIGGKKYYQMKIICDYRWTNCDCKPTYSKVKFVAKEGYKVSYLKVLYECPPGVYSFNLYKKKDKAMLPCFKNEKSVMATLMNNKGDILYLPLTSLDSLKSKVMFSKCEKDKSVIVKRWAGIFPIYKRSIYRKYIIPSSLLTREENYYTIPKELQDP